MLSKNNYIAIFTLTFLFFFLLPILVPFDLWDGVIISYASELNDLSGIKFWFFSSGWHLQYFQISLFHWISSNILIDFLLLNKIINYLFSVIFIREVCLIGSKLIKLESNWVSLLALFLASSPVFSVLSSSVMTFHFLSLTICLVGVRFFHTNHATQQIIGLLLILLSLSYPANLGLCIGISFLNDCCKSKKKSDFAFLSIRTIVVSILAISFYFVQGLLFDPYGFWEGYYSIRNPFTLKGILVIGFRSIEYISHFILIVIPILLFLLINYSREDLLYKPNIKKILGLGVLLASSCLSFILVGKSASIIDIYDWSTRHVLTFYTPFSLILIYILRELYVSQISHASLIKVIIGLPIIFNIVLGGYSWNDKFQRADFYKTFIEFAKQNPSKFESQFVIIERDMKPSIRSYEYNYLYFIANSNNNTFITESKFSLDNALKKISQEKLGFSQTEIIAFQNFAPNEKINYLKENKPSLLKALEMYFIADLREWDTNNTINDPSLRKWYGSEPGIKLKRNLREIANDLFNENQ